MKFRTIIGASLALLSPMVMASNGADYGLESKENFDLNNKGLATTGGAIKFATFTASSAQSIQAPDTWNYAGGGCTNNSSGSGIFLDESLNLPVGSIIVSAGLFYRDANTGGTQYEIYNFDAAGNFDVVVDITGPAFTGATSVGDFLWLTTDPGISNVGRITMQADPSADACMVRIGYIPYDIASDVIFANKNEY